jgi:hypothetical protein
MWKIEGQSSAGSITDFARLVGYGSFRYQRRKTRYNFHFSWPSPCFSAVANFMLVTIDWKTWLAPKHLTFVLSLMIVHFIAIKRPLSRIASIPFGAQVVDI